MSAEVQQLVYFVSGMWCSTCAKNVRETVANLEGVESADLNYASKLLLVRPSKTLDLGPLDQEIQSKVVRTGFGIKKQSEGWILQFHESLKQESNRKVPWTLISLVWFLAMWSSMLAFAGYLGGDLSKIELYALSVASSAFGLPAILLGIFPFGKAGVRALIFGKLLTLDLFIFFGGLSALAVSVAALLTQSHVTYSDSGSMIIAILLLTKKIENSIASTLTSKILFQLHPKNKTVEVYRKNQWVTAETDQIKKGDLVKVMAQETVPFDGRLESERSEINNHLMNGESLPVKLKNGDHVLAGAIANENFVLEVTSPQGERKIDAWAEAALLSENQKSQYTRLFSRIEGGLVIFAFLGAVIIATVQAFKGADTLLIIESFFVGILIFCPCLFASIIPLAKQITYLALQNRGIFISRADALFDLSKISQFFIDKTGTLESTESIFVPLSEDIEVATPYLKGLAKISTHPILRGLTITGATKDIAKIEEHPGKGLAAKAVDGTEIIVGQASFLEEMGVAPHESSTYPFVVINRRIVGQIYIQSAYDERSHNFLKSLLEQDKNAQVQILSGDPRPSAGTNFVGLDPRISFHGNLAPEEKAREISSDSVFIGDGLNDTLALAKARVSFRIGHRVLGFAPVDFHLQIPNLNLILSTIRYSKKFRKVLFQTGCAAFFYNAIALTLAGLGKFSPLGAVISMLFSFAIMLLSISRLHKVPEVNT